MENYKSKFWKFLFGFLAIIVAAIALIYGLQAYREHQNQKNLENFVNELERQRAAEYQNMMADTYGGKTPQETLRMYIEAVEKGNYELASKYFMEKYREKELNSFKGATKENITKYLSLLEQAISSKGEYSPDGKSFSIYEPVSVDFWLYPNGIWKLEKI